MSDKLDLLDSVLSVLVLLLMLDSELALEAVLVLLLMLL